MPPPPVTSVDADNLLNSLGTEETEVLSQPDDIRDESRPQVVPTTPSSNNNNKSSPKICEICGKQFEGKNRAMLKVQHMANHFKDKLFADLKDKSSPFKCPMEGCTYQTKHKPDWARHYGSVHQFIGKYLKEYLDQRREQQGGELSVEATTTSTSCSSSTSGSGSGLDVQGVTDGERTYSAFLPKAELHQVMKQHLNVQWRCKYGVPKLRISLDHRLLLVWYSGHIHFLWFKLL